MAGSARSRRLFGWIVCGPAFFLALVLSPVLPSHAAQGIGGDPRTGNTITSFVSSQPGISTQIYSYSTPNCLSDPSLESQNGTWVIPQGKVGRYIRGYIAIPRQDIFASDCIGPIGVASLELPAPTITGDLVRGSTLTAHATSVPSVGIDYVWHSNGVDVGAGPTYMVGPSDVHHTITVTASASRLDATATADSVSTDPITGGTLPTTGSVSISGSPTIGSTLTRASTVVSDPIHDTLTVEWLRDGSPVAGETGSAYVIITADLDKTFTYRETRTSDGYDPAVSTSNSIGPVTKRPQTITFAPDTSGTVGGTQTLSALSDSDLEVAVDVDVSSDLGVCSLTGSTLSYAAAGTCVVTATQEGNDTFETATAVTKSISLVVGDSDGDGLSDSLEASLGSNPAKTDTDGDGLTDGDEYNGITSVKEVTRCDLTQVPLGLIKTDLLNADTDGDGLKDGAELNGAAVNQKVITGTKKVIVKKKKKTVEVFYTLTLLQSNPLVKDTDGDGLTDKDEVTGSKAKKFKYAKTDPANCNTDLGARSDGYELRHGTNPVKKG